MSGGAEQHYAVLLHSVRVATLSQKGDHTRFAFTESYLADPERPVLGLRFEENLRARYAATLRLPMWFSNLLPEGPLRVWIAQDRGVSMDREMELLAQVGHDLPGAVQVLPVDGHDDPAPRPADSTSGSSAAGRRGPTDSPWRFSLAGVALKFSMLAKGDRLTIPAADEHGDWLVKFPDHRYADVPRNEFTMMSLARDIGIDVPEIRLVHRDELDELPSRMWPGTEEWVYAVRRFDRAADGQRTPVHIEDLAQVRDKYPHEKYEGTFETVAALVYRGRDREALCEAVRRIAFCIVTGNGDAHLKNWSLIYLDRRVPTLSPAYDLVSTTAYAPDGESDDLGLRFGGTKRFAQVRLADFRRLGDQLRRRLGGVDVDLVAVATDTVRQVRTRWSNHREKLAANPELLARVDEWIGEHSRRLLDGA